MCYVLCCCVFHPDGRFYDASTEVENAKQFIKVFCVKNSLTHTNRQTNRQTWDSQLSGQKEPINDRAAEYETVKHSLSMNFYRNYFVFILYQDTSMFRKQKCDIFSSFRFFSIYLLGPGHKTSDLFTLSICTIYAEYELQIKKGIIWNGTRIGITDWKNSKKNGPTKCNRLMVHISAQNTDDDSTFIGWALCICIMVYKTITQHLANWVLSMDKRIYGITDSDIVQIYGGCSPQVHTFIV